MKRIAIILLFIFFIFIFPQYIVIPAILLLAVVLPYIFYEIMFFGILFDIIYTPNFPIYTVSSLIVLIGLFFIRKRMSLHV